MKPIRIQRKRTKGWRMPDNTVYVGRPGLWRNMFPIGKPDEINGQLTAKNRQEAVNYFRDFISGKTVYGKFNKKAYAEIVRHELKGKNLACWCPLNEPCHADVLIEVANG